MAGVLASGRQCSTAPPPRTPPRLSSPARRRAVPAAPEASLRRHGGPRPASHVRAGVTAIETQDVPPSHAGRGRMTEQGMAQGQPGRPPPGHARRAPRHFVRDAVVFEDYTIAEGRVIPQGAPRTRYHPETCPALPQQLARLARGDTSAVLAFVRTYGLLGYAPLAAAVGRGVPSDAAGDPLGWIWAQAETVALCLHLTYGLQAGDDAALQHSLRAVQLPQPPQTDGGPQLIVPAVWDQPRFPSAGRRRCTAPRTGGCMPAPCAVK